jgi:glycine cleavage system aminomethyltransferase T
MTRIRLAIYRSRSQMSGVIRSGWRSWTAQRSIAFTALFCNVTEVSAEYGRR